MEAQGNRRDRPVGRMRNIACIAIAAFVLTVTTTAHAGPTSVTGGSQAHSNRQPSLALNYMISLQGLYPSHSGGSYNNEIEPYLGEVNIFAGNFAPRGWALCQGQILPISQHDALFSILGTTYGGDGRTTFALPDLRGRTVIGAGQGAGLTNRPVGQEGGVERVTLTEAQMPTHNHTMPSSSETTGNTGGGQPHTNMQPYLAMNHTLSTTGPFPNRTGSGSPSGAIGTIDIFAGHFAPGDSELLQGQHIPIASNPALYAILGPTYGGDGRTDLAVPDLQGRVAIGAGSGSPLTPRVLGSESGVEEVILTESQMPSHAHNAPASSSDATSATGGGQAHPNMQPDLALNYIIALQGLYPTGGAGGSEPYLGQIELFAGNFAPAGWAFCDGSLLSVSDNAALYSILGATYGGDGRTNFALPDLRGRAVIGAGHGPGLSNYALGQQIGAETVALSAAQLPAHSHSTPDIPAVPEPTSTALCLVGLAGLLARRVRSRNHG